MQENFECFSLPDEMKEILRASTSLKKALEQGRTAQEILKFSDEKMGKFYQNAYQLFELKMYEDASCAFLFLATLNPHNHDYWLGLGMATQLCHEYEAAIDAYELAAIIDIDSPVPYFYLAKCLFAIHDRESSLQALELAIETAGEKEEFAELRRHAEMAKEVLLKTQDLD
jgi:type III secretion system low calcium response chaperone LcrH/SycD